MAEQQRRILLQRRLAGDEASLQRLTNNRYVEEAVAWSPDGTKIAFVSTWTCHRAILAQFVSQIYLQQLTTNAADDIAPRWSSDGTKIIFESTRLSRDTDLFVMDVALGESDLKQITSNSADDSQIAFMSTRSSCQRNSDNKQRR